MRVETKLKSLGLELPPTPAPAANYLGAVLSGNLLFVSGHVPTQDGKFTYIGKLGKELSVEEGYQAARLVALNCLASAKIKVKKNIK
jgi:enamine deaminase RidA (YjgF/YER057c/UK114 family)